MEQSILSVSSTPEDTLREGHVQQQQHQQPALERVQKQGEENKAELAQLHRLIEQL